MGTKTSFVLLLIIMLMIIGASDAMEIILGSSRATIVSKELSAVTAGQYATLTVKVKNEGSDDYITVKASSGLWQFNTDRKYVKSGATETFTLSGQALGGATDTTAQYTVMADGTGQDGDDTETGTGTVYGNSGENIPRQKSSGFDIILLVISIMALTIIRISKKAHRR